MLHCVKSFVPKFFKLCYLAPAMWCHLRMRDDRKMLIVKEKLNLTSISCHIPARVRCSDRQSAIEALLPESFFIIRWKFFTCFKPAISAFTTSTF